MQPFSKLSGPIGGKPLKSSLRPLRPDIPIYLAAEGPRNIAMAGELCTDGSRCSTRPTTMASIATPSTRDSPARAGADLLEKRSKSPEFENDKLADAGESLMKGSRLGSRIHQPVAGHTRFGGRQASCTLLRRPRNLKHTKWHPLWFPILNEASVMCICPK